MHCDAIPCAVIGVLRHGECVTVQVDLDIEECRLMKETGHCKAHMHVVDCFLVFFCTFVYLESYLVVVVYSELFAL